MRWFVVLIWALTSVACAAQTTQVNPADLTLTVTVANGDVAPYVQEMVLVTIEGQYRRHVTREIMEQPDLEGFNWMQLGPDQWYDTTERGKKVKNLRRRMALYPDRPGTLTIGAFTHHLTLTDEGDDWFPHDIQSQPITIEVLPAPEVKSWWFPVRHLEVSDTWSNAPDRLKPGEGVLRVIRVEATGVPPDMIPPMPELHSPSAMIFAHPEKRLVELSPEGPVSVAFWRWTIRPGNHTSAIVEPISFDYFDTRNRVPRTVTISAQRVAMDESSLPDPVLPPEPARLFALPVLILFGVALAGGLGAILFGRQFAGLDRLRQVALLDPLRRKMRRAAAARDLPGLRRAAIAMLARDGYSVARCELLKDLDRDAFGRTPGHLDGRAFARRFLASR
ncbi:BatD family protein [Puniceibacterium sediminis]|uniref:Oxygen tolerance n=1 Tax=Puniceibacterium sediminis TaxID=1608407 RepID=A0A238Y8I7_9RHOB|nr:BatD family protein [Puniceibacterium sediminis]SNR67148.1 Oxygen tolerance [Puniceibacterium sediminis]